MAAKKRAVEDVPVPEGPVYVALKPLMIDDKRYEIGEAVPEASCWPRIESWVRAGYVELKEQGGE